MAVKNDSFDIKSMLNCVNSGGKIESRKGFYTRAEDSVFKSYYADAFDMSFVLTDCYLFLDGKYGRIAVSITDNLMDSITYNMMLICTDKTTIPLGRMSFTTSGVETGFPDSFAVFSGKANQGSGIYFISRRLYDNGEMISIRELSLDREQWLYLTDSMIYTPLVLANGRGEAYHSAEFLGRALSLPAPLPFESKNMLNPRFNASYTTDGASSGFSLPYANIDNNSVMAELLYRDKKYSFKIMGTEVKSPSVSVESNSVVMNVNREEGRVYFTIDGSGRWVPEFTGSLNNLCITAYKTVAEHIKTVGAFSASQGIESNISLLYKSVTEPSAVVINSPLDPLYFPENTASLLGHSQKEVGAVIASNGNFFAFKEGEIYSAAIKAYTPNKKTVSVLENIRETDEYRLSFKKAVTFSAKAIRETVCETDGQIFFQSSIGEIWKIKAGSSAPSYEKISAANETFDFAVTDKGRYILIKDNAAFVLEKGEKGYITGEWTLPEKAVGGFSYVGKAILLFSCYIDEVYMIYAAGYGGDKDIRFLSEFETEERSISSALCLTDEKSAKRIHKITVCGEGKDINLSLLKSEKAISKRHGRFKDGFADFYMGANLRGGVIKLSFDTPTVIESVSTLANLSI